MRLFFTMPPYGRVRPHKAPFLLTPSFRALRVGGEAACQGHVRTAYGLYMAA